MSQVTQVSQTTELGISTLAHPPAAPQPRPGMLQAEQHPEWHLLSGVPLQLYAAAVVPGFKVRDLLRLRPGQIIQTSCESTDNVPVLLSSVQLGWCEFEVVDQRLALRLTRLA